MPKVMYSVQKGPDESHMWDNDWFDRLKDAVEHAKNLKPAPGGKARPYKIERFEWFKDPNGATPNVEHLRTKVLETNVKNRVTEEDIFDI